MNEILVESDGLRLERDGPVATLTLARPDRRNVLGQDMLGRLPTLLATVAAEASLNVLVVTGGAGRDFSAGAQIDEFAVLEADPGAAAAFQARFAAAQSAMERFPKPSAAMISRYCIGGGCGLSLGCDVRFADPSARLGVTPATLGLAYGLADTRRLVEAVGFDHAADLLFSGRLLEAEEARAIGLVTAVVPAEALADYVKRWAARVASHPPAAVRTLKATLARVRAGAREDDDASRATFIAAFSTPAFAERRRAFMARSSRPAAAVDQSASQGVSVEVPQPPQPR